MKKYIYGSVLIAVVAALAVFFFRTPETSRQLPQTIVAITFRFPEGYELTPGAPFLLTWKSEDPAGNLSVAVPVEGFNPLVAPYKLAFSPAPGAAAVVLNARLYYCQKSSRMCFQDDFQARIPLVTEPVPVIWKITPKSGKG